MICPLVCSTWIFPSKLEKKSVFVEDLVLGKVRLQCPYSECIIIWTAAFSLTVSIPKILA